MPAIRLATAAVLAVATASVASATTGTCTVSKAAAAIAVGGPGAQSLPPLGVAVGVKLPVTFDEATGTFSLSRDPWATQFGADGATGGTGFGPTYSLIMNAGTVSGTIDASGNITLPGFPFAFGTTACNTTPPTVYPLTANVEASEQFVPFGRDPAVLHGTPLDFTTGAVTLVGGGEIDSCIAGPLVTALLFTCTLDPIPDKTKLPAPPAVAKVSGTVKIGKVSSPPSQSDKGDVLTVNVRIVPGAAVFDYTQALFIQVTDTGKNTVAFLEVPAGKLAKAGKRFQVTDSDGSAIDALIGRKLPSTPGGTIRIVAGKKATVLKARVQGLDLAAVSGSGTATVALGPYALAHDFAVRGSGKRRRLH